MDEGLIGVANALSKTLFGQIILFIVSLYSLLRVLSTFIVINLVDTSKDHDTLDVLDLNIEEIIKRFERGDALDNPLLREFQIFLSEKKLREAKKEVQILSSKIKELTDEYEAVERNDGAGSE